MSISSSATNNFNAIIGFPSYTDDATVSEFTAGDWQTGYPVENLQALPLSYAARTADLDVAKTKVKIILAEKAKVQLVVFCVHNLSISARYRIRLFDDVALSQELADTGWQKVWPVMFDEDEVDWEGRNWWDRAYTDEQIASLPWHRPALIDTEVYSSGLTVELDDAANPDGFIQIGRLEIASARRLPMNYAPGAQMGFINTTTVETAKGGVEFFDVSESPRTFEGSIPMVAHETALQGFWEQLRRMGLHKPFFWWPNPTDELNMLRESFLARNSRISPLVQLAGGVDQIPLSFKEIF